MKAYPRLCGRDLLARDEDKETWYFSRAGQYVCVTGLSQERF
jgi:hypothetical protein